MQRSQLGYLVEVALLMEGRTAADLQRTTRWKPEYVAALLDGTATINRVQALRLARYFGTTADFWLKAGSSFGATNAVTAALEAGTGLLGLLSPHRPDF